MKPAIPFEMATCDVKTMSQEERALFYRDAIRSAHAARSDAVRGLFGAAVKRLERYPLVTRALVDSAAVLAMVIALAATASEPLTSRMASVSIGHIGSGLPLLW